MTTIKHLLKLDTGSCDTLIEPPDPCGVSSWGRCFSKIASEKSYGGFCPTPYNSISAYMLYSPSAISFERFDGLKFHKLFQTRLAEPIPIYALHFEIFETFEIFQNSFCMVGTVISGDGNFKMSCYAEQLFIARSNIYSSCYIWVNTTSKSKIRWIKKLSYCL